MDATTYADLVVKILTEAAAELPDGFYCSFDYTTTGQNLAHPIAWGAIVRGLPLSNAQKVGIDVRFNDGAEKKFQPDVVLFDQALKPLLCVDYESPNSSDSRVPFKDIDAFVKWQCEAHLDTSYVIVTTLPDAPRPAWELRYTAAGQWNDGMRPHVAAVRANPFRFWKAKYEVEFAKLVGCNIAWVNMDQREASRIYPAR